MTADLKKQEDIIAKIKAGDEEEIVSLYTSYRNDFIHWAGFKFQLSREEALDIFQDTLVSFYDSIKQGKLTEIHYSIKTYLYAIAKHMIYNKLKYDKKFKPDQDDFETFSSVESTDEPLILTERKKIMVALLAQMREPCATLLRLFYFDAFSMEAIASKLHYKNTDVVKTQKLRCIKELKRKVESYFKKGDI